MFPIFNRNSSNNVNADYQNILITILGGLLSLTLVIATISPAIANVLMGLILVLSIVSKITRNRILMLLKTKLGYIILAWLFCLLFFVLVGHADIKTAMRGLLSWRKFLLFPIALVVFNSNFKLQQNALILVGALFILAATISYVSFFLGVPFTKIQVPGLVMQHHVTQTIMFSVASLIFIVKLYVNWSTLNFRIRILYSFAIIYLFINVFFISTGRSGYIAIVIMFVVSFFILLNSYNFRKRFVAIVLLCGVFCVIAFSSNTFKQRVNLAISEVQAGINSPEYTSVGLRIVFYTQTVNMLPEYLVFAAGTGGFYNAYAKQVAGLPYPSNTPANDPHNQYMLILVEQGILGLFIFCLLLYAIYQLRPPLPIFRALGISVLSAWLVTSIFNSHFSTFNEGTFIWIWLGLCFSQAVDLRTRA